MVTIKGPLTINRKTSFDDLAELGIEIELPFTATGWKSEKNGHLVKSDAGSKVKMVKTKIKIEEPVVLDAYVEPSKVKATSYKRKYLKKSSK